MVNIKYAPTTHVHIVIISKISLAVLICSTGCLILKYNMWKVTAASAGWMDVCLSS